jgi:hypothetical protein
MAKIYYESDFKLTEKFAREELVGVPFRYTYYTKTKYEASWDGKDGYKNCKREKDGSITIIFNSHGLSIGKLNVKREYFIPDSDFEDGIRNKIDVEDTGIRLVNGEGDDITVDTEVIPPYIYIQEIVDNTEDASPNKALSANQGKVLNERINVVITSIEVLDNGINEAFKQVNTSIIDNAKVIAEAKAELTATNKDLNETKSELVALEEVVATKADASKVAQVERDVQKNAGAISNNTARLDVLEGEGEGSVKNAVAEGIAQVVADAPEDFDTLKEVSDYIASDKTKAAEIETSISNLNKKDKAHDDALQVVGNRVTIAEGKITELQGNVATLQTEVSKVKNEVVPQAVAEGIAQVVADAPEDLDTIKEVADYIASDKTKASQIETAISNLQLNDKEIMANLDTLVVNDLITGGADKALSAEMGKELSAKLTKLGKEVFRWEFKVEVYGVSMPIKEGLTLTKGFTYKIRYSSIGGVFSDCALRLRYNGSDIWIVYPNTESNVYEFTPSDNYDNVTLAFVAYYGAESYGKAVIVSFDNIEVLTKEVTSLKEDVKEVFPVISVLGIDTVYDTYAPIRGGMQQLGICTLAKGQLYRITINLSEKETNDVYCGVIGPNQETITGSVVIRKGETARTFEFVPIANYSAAKIYISFYHEPADGQSITTEIHADNIYELLESIEPEDMNSFVIRTKDQFSLASHLGFGRESTWVGDYMPEGWIPQLVFLHISDTHQNKTCSKNAITALNMLSTRGVNKGNNARFLIHTGDIKTTNYLSDFSYWVNARSNANKPVYHVVGNHDCGLDNKVSTSGSDEQVYASNTEPFIEEWDLTTANSGTPHPNGKNYYFKDFSDEKVRLIVLYEYEHDMEVNPVDSSLLKYSRVYRAFRQEQIDWLIESLMTTPSGWGVMIAKHQMEYADDNDNTFNSYFLRGRGVQYTYVGSILPDIVQAFIDKSVLNQSYQQTGAVVTTLRAEADFSNNGAEFICYLSGHTHLDSIHYLRDYPKQLELTIGCDNTNYTHNSDMAQVAGTKTEDVINVCAVDRNRGYIYIVRIGSDMSYTGQRRDILSIKYRKIDQ